MIGNVIHRDVVARLEEAHLANSFCADARCSDVGNRACRELQSCVGRVDSIRQDRYANRMKRSHLDLFAHEPLDDIQIVNHQIEHDIDIK